MKKLTIIAFSLLFLSSCCLTRYKFKGIDGRIVNLPHKIIIETRVNIDSLGDTISKIKGLTSFKPITKYKFEITVGKYYDKHEVLQPITRILKAYSIKNQITLVYQNEKILN